MLKNEMKAALAILGAVVAPLFAQADQAMSMSQGQQQQQQQPGYVSGEMVKAGQLPGAFNQSAAYVCDDGWDVFVDADYILWNWSQDEGMHTGFSGLDDFSGANFALAPNLLTPGYASGFQVGVGFNMKGMDDWNFYGQYTWYKNSASNDDEVEGSVPGIVTVDFEGNTAVSLAYNNADFLLQRSFYFGKKLTSKFYTGLRALWINTETTVSASGTASALGGLVTLDVRDSYLNIQNSSWALGPKFGLDSSWLLGYGLKFLSNISTSVLYTRYTGSMDGYTDGSGRFISALSLTNTLDIDESNYGALRPVIETYLGLGWGSYFCDNNFHLDLAVGYDFNVHFNYITNAVAPSHPSNLYLHGLNVKARFDF